MTQNTPSRWEPSLKWHLKTLALAAGCVALLFIALKITFNLLPDTFAPKRPVLETTPWLTE